MVDSVMSPLSVLVAFVLGGVLLLWLHHCSSGWRGATKSGARLPKGSFGWPFIGESLELGRDPRLYGRTRVKRYGSIFKTNLIMKPTIAGSTPEFSKFILTSPKLFCAGHPPTIAGTVPNGFVLKDGPSHLSLKKIVTKPFKPETLRTKLDVLEDIVLQHMASWEQQGTVVGLDGMEKITLETALYLALGVRDLGKSAEGREIQEGLKALNKAILSAPINLPGTVYNKGFKAKARVTQLIKSLLEERRKNTSIHSDDILGVMLAARDDEDARKEVNDLSDDTVVDNIVLMVFGAYDTTATGLVWILKLLNDHPDVFRRLQAEHEEILKEKRLAVEGQALTWDDLRKMEYTRKFLQEVQRYLSIAPIVPKKAIEDTEYEGYLIPKGWTVVALPQIIHHNPEFYPDPSSFNPDRFNVAPKPYTFLPFSIGAHMCPGGEFVRVMSSIVVHHLCTTFTHESAAPDRGIVYSCFIKPVTGYPIKIRRNLADQRGLLKT